MIRQGYFLFMFVPCQSLAIFSWFAVRQAFRCSSCALGMVSGSFGVNPCFGFQDGPLNPCLYFGFYHRQAQASYKHGGEPGL